MSDFMRHFHMAPGPSIADPCYLCVFYEARYSRPEDGQEYRIWSGWRCRIIRWLINRWMPTPTVWSKPYFPKPSPAAEMD
jgi:hypothetical protein